MSRKAFSGIMVLTILLISTLTLAFNIQQVKATDGTIYIRADGSVDPPTAPIQRDGNLYTFTADIYGSIVVERDNIVIDGAGYTLQGAESGRGIDLSGRTNVTVRNTQIKNFQYGVYLYYSSNNIISGNSITANDYSGVELYKSSGNSVSGNNITANNARSVTLTFSSNNVISGNNITANIGYGVYLYSSSNNIISGNNITNNGCGFLLYYSSNNIISGNTFTNDGLVDWDSYQNVVENNTVNGKPLVYLEGVADHSVSDAGQVILVNCDRIRVENLNLSRTIIGVQLLKTNNSVIRGNNITANKWHGVELGYSSNNVIRGNNITANEYYGIVLGASYNNIISGNNITNTYIFGVALGGSFDNVISGNNITNNSVGVWLSSSYNNIISGNNITNNISQGVRLTSSSNNWLYHNNFINNGMQVYSYNSISTWDDGYPSGGNYWSDYTGVDLYGGSYQNVSGSDGIGDAPYVIDENNIDNYPLMNSWGSGTPIASFTWTPSVPEVGEVVTFDASASMPIGGEIVSYEWDFGDGSHATGKIATHVYSSAGTFTVTLNVTDSEGLWDIEQKQIEVKAPPPPLAVSISPLSASILVGQSVTFTSTVTGGYTPYSYQWYLNGAPVSGATSPSWTFTPTTSGIYYVNLKITDDKGNTAQSDTARITVASVPVGGYSIPIKVNTKPEPTTPYIALIATLTAIFITVKRKTKIKH